jgi:glucose dehydrogenase
VVIHVNRSCWQSGNRGVVAVVVVVPLKKKNLVVPLRCDQMKLVVVVVVVVVVVMGGSSHTHSRERRIHLSSYFDHDKYPSHEEEGKRRITLVTLGWRRTYAGSNA